MRKLIAVFLFFLSIFVAPHAYAEKSSGSSAALVSHAASTSRDARSPAPDGAGRSRILREFLASHNSPLTPFSHTFVTVADQYNLDWRLLAAISGVESTFGREIPNGSHNAWGWGIYGDQAIYFSSWEEGIKTISKELKTTYIDRWNAESVSEIGRYYATSPTWASRVTYFMNKIGEFGTRNPDLTLSISI